MLTLDEEKDQCTTTKAKQEEERGPARGREQWEGEPGQACVGAWVVACVPRPSLVGSPGLVDVISTCSLGNGRQHLGTFQ